MSEKLGWVVQVAVGGQGRNGKSSLCRTRSRDPVDQEWGFVKLRWNLVRYLSVVGWLAGIVRSAQGRTEGGDSTEMCLDSAQDCPTVRKTA